jgi:hypothetical protein
MARTEIRKFSDAGKLEEVGGTINLGQSGIKQVSISGKREIEKIHCKLLRKAECIYVYDFASTDSATGMEGA